MAKSDFLDPRWQKFRLERLEIANWGCEACGNRENTLHVHHRFYITGRKPWEYPLLCTVVLCEECHGIEHEFNADFRVLGATDWEHVLELLFGLSANHGFPVDYIRTVLADAWDKLNASTQ